MAVEPAASPVLTQKRAGKALKPGPHKIQGIGAGFIPDTLDLSVVDAIEQVTNEEAIDTPAGWRARGRILAGISCGAAVAVAARSRSARTARARPSWSILPDSGERYLSTVLFDGMFDAQGNARERRARDDRLSPIVDALCAQNAEPAARPPAQARAAILPSREVVASVVGDLRAVLFPWHFGAADVSEEGLAYYVGRTLDRRSPASREQVRVGLLLRLRARRHGAAWSARRARARSPTPSRPGSPPSARCSAATRRRPSTATPRRPAPTRRSSATRG